MGGGSRGDHLGMAGANPFVQMIGGGAGGPSGRSQAGGASESQTTQAESDEDILREIQKVNDELRDIRWMLQRISDATEDT